MTPPLEGETRLQKENHETTDRPGNLPPRIPGRENGRNLNEKRRNERIWMIAGSVLIVALIIAGFIYWTHRNVESTDDAFVDGDIVPISSKISGQVIQLNVNDNQYVKQGDIMVRIDPAPYQAQLNQERARLASAEAEAKRTTADATRYAELFRKDEISRQQWDNAEAAAASAVANVNREKAAVQQAELNLSYTNVIAPINGMVTRKSVELGMYLQTGQSLLSLVSKDVWVTANFKETQLTDIRPGQRARIKVDAYPNLKLYAHVDSIQAGTGARFSLFPPENATGNFVKVVQRVPVKIVFDQGELERHPFLAPGLSVIATVEVR